MQNKIDDVAGDALEILDGHTIKPTGISLAKEYGKLLVNKGAAAANATLQRLKKDTVASSVDETEFNSLGYDFITTNKMKDALQVFKQNVCLFPASWNAYDSYW